MATRLFSEEGVCCTVDAAVDLDLNSSRERGPYVVSQKNHRTVYWVSGSRGRRHYFQRREGEAASIERWCQNNEGLRERYRKTAELHVLVQLALYWRLHRWIKSGRALSCGLSNANLLAGATDVEFEFQVNTPFGKLRADLALVAKRHGRTLLIAIIEVESTHRFSSRRLWMGHSLGVPTIYVDVSRMSLGEVTPSWAEATLESLATATSGAGVGVYMHKLLRLPFVPLGNHEAHHLEVTAPREQICRLHAWMQKVATCPQLPLSWGVLNERDFPSAVDGCAMEIMSIHIPGHASSEALWRFIQAFTRNVITYCDATISHEVVAREPRSFFTGAQGRVVAQPVRQLLRTGQL